MRRVVEQIHVQIAVAVVIEEERLRRVSDVIEPVFLRAIGECAVTIVGVQHVPSVHREVIDGGDVDVDVAVAIDVGHGDAGFPSDRVGDTGALGDVLEMVVPLVQIESIRADVRREIEVGQPIVVDVTDGDSAPVVVVQIREDVER